MHTISMVWTREKSSLLAEFMPIESIFGFFLVNERNSSTILVNPFIPLVETCWDTITDAWAKSRKVYYVCRMCKTVSLIDDTVHFGRFSRVVNTEESNRKIVPKPCVLVLWNQQTITRKISWFRSNIERISYKGRCLQEFRVSIVVARATQNHYFSKIVHETWMRPIFKCTVITILTLSSFAVAHSHSHRFLIYSLCLMCRAIFVLNVKYVFFAATH